MNLGMKIQSAFSTFPLILVEGEETETTIKQVTASLKNCVDSIQSKVKIGEEEYEVEKILSCDLKTLWLLTGRK